MVQLNFQLIIVEKTFYFSNWEFNRTVTIIIDHAPIIEIIEIIMINLNKLQ